MISCNLCIWFSSYFATNNKNRKFLCSENFPQSDATLYILCHVNKTYVFVCQETQSVSVSGWLLLDSIIKSTKMEKITHCAPVATVYYMNCFFLLLLLCKEKPYSTTKNSHTYLAGTVVCTTCYIIFSIAPTGAAKQSIIAKDAMVYCQFLKEFIFCAWYHIQQRLFRHHNSSPPQSLNIWIVDTKAQRFLK